MPRSCWRTATERPRHARGQRPRIVKLRLDGLEKRLAGTLAPVWFVTGDEPLLVNEATDAIRRAARAQGFDTRDLFVAERGFDWNRLAEAGQSLSLFSEKRIIDLRLPTGKPGDKGGRAIAELCAQPNDDTLLLVTAPKLDKGGMSTKWVKALDAAGVVLQIWPLEARELPGWIHSRCVDAGLEPDREAVLHLARRTEGNLLAAQQEIDKLALLAPSRAVTVEDVEAAVADSARYNVFKLADEALAGRTDRALRMLGGLRREGVAATLVLWALGRELRQLAAMAEQVAAGAGVPRVLSQFRVWQKREGLFGAALSRVDCQLAYALVVLTERADRAAKGQSGEDPWQLLLRITAALASGRLADRAA